MEMSRIGCFILALSLAGCGPVIATSNIIQADAALEEARLLNAQTYAPYWFHSAKIYLKKARSLDGKSEYQHASNYAGVALSRAQKALELTRRKIRSTPVGAADSGGEGLSW